MTEIGNLTVQLGLNSQSFASGVSSAKSALSGLESAAKSAGSSTAGVLSPLTSAIRNVGSVAGSATGGVLNFAGSLVRVAGSVGFAVYGIEKLANVTQGAGQALLGYDASLEQTRIALGTLLGSGDAATQMLSQLQTFAADTPFNLPGVENASRQLLAFGFQAKDIIPDLTAIGDAVSALGGGVFEINRVTLALGQMHAAGVVHAQDMMQLTQVGISAWQILADKMGVTTAQLQTMVSAGIVPADQAIQDLLSGMEERYKGAMDAQSKTMTGIISNIQDSANMALGQIMMPLFDVVKGDLKDIQDYLASPDFAAWADRAQQSVARWSDKLQGIVVNDGPKVLDFFQTAASAAETIAGDLKTVYDWADKIGGVFGQPGWQVLLEIYAAAKVAPLAMTVGKGLASAGGSILGGGSSPAATLPLMNITADVVNVNGKSVTSGAGNLAKAGEAASAAGGELALGATVAEIAGIVAPIAAAVAIPVLINQASPAKVWNVSGQNIPGSSTQGIQPSQYAGQLTADAYMQRGGIAGPYLNAAVLQAATQANQEYATSLNAIKDAYVGDTGASEALTQRMQRLYELNAGQANVIQQTTAAEYAQIAATTAQNNAVEALAGTMQGLARTYNVALDVEQVYGKQQSQYKTLNDDIGNAIDIINQKKKDGIPLTSQENLLLDQSNTLQGRLKGGMKDATEQRGLAAAAATELMLAQDKVNQMQKDGITSGADYEQAVKDVQTAQENAKQFGGDPMAQSMSDLHLTIQDSLVPAIDTLVQKLKDVISPPPVDIQIADEAAINEIQRIKSMIESGAYMPMYITPQQQHTGFASGGVVAHNMVASINEYGPELVVLPYAGRFAAGGTIGMANGGAPGMAVLPAGAQVIPAAQTAAVMQALSSGLAPTEAILAAATSDGEQIAKAMVDGVVAGVSSDTMVPRLTADLLPSLLKEQDDISKQLDLAKLSGASPDQVAKLQAQLDAITSLIQRWAEHNGTTVDAAINASVSAITSGDAAKQIHDALVKVQTAAFQNFDQVVSGQAISQLQSQIATLLKERAVALATHASQDVIDAINQQLDQANQQLAEDQQVQQAAIAAGYGKQVVTISSATIDQIKGMEAVGAISADSLVSTIAQSLSQGMLTIQQATDLIPSQSLPALKSFEQNLKQQWAEAVLTGADNADALQKELQLVDAWMNKVSQTAQSTTPTIGDYVAGLGYYQGGGAWSNHDPNSPVGGDFSGGVDFSRGGSSGATGNHGLAVYGSMTLNFQRPATVDDILQKIGI